MSILEKIKEAVINGNSKEVKKYVEDAVNGGIDASSILEDGLILGMGILGGRFKRNEVYVPEVLIAARAMHAGMDIVKPLIAQGGGEKTVILVGTVKGDLHDIGKNLVIMMLEGAGFKVIDMGIDVSSEKFIEAVKEYKPQIVGLSALLTTTMPELKSTLEQLKSYSKELKVMVGGAPVTQEYADIIGADAYAPDAASAAEIAKEIIL